MYEKQVHKDGIRRAVVNNMSQYLTRYFDKHELKNLFRLNPEGQCDFLERLGERGRTSSEGHELKHDGIIGMTNHDSLYTEEAHEDDEEEDDDQQMNAESQEAPFSSPSKPANLTPHKVVESVDDSKPVVKPILGKSQRVMQKGGGMNTPKKLGDKEKPFSSPSKSVTMTPRSPAKPKTEEFANTDSYDDTIGEILHKSDELFSTGQREEAMKVLMDAMDTLYDELGKDQKMLLHGRIAAMANELRWL